MGSKSSFMSQNMLDNDLTIICKTKVTLRFNKPAHIGIYQLDLSILDLGY